MHVAIVTGTLYKLPTANTISSIGTSRYKAFYAGTIKIPGITDIFLSDVLFCPDLGANLMSVSQLLKNGSLISFDKKSCTIKPLGSSSITATLRKGLFYINLRKNAH